MHLYFLALRPLSFLSCSMVMPLASVSRGITQLAIVGTGWIGWLDSYWQHEDPGKAQESQRLPAPQCGAIRATLRSYGSKA